MGLRIITTKDGAHRPTWYARLNRDGRRIDVNLKVPIRGRIPTDAAGRISLGASGDAAFERSRQEALEQLQAESSPPAPSESVPRISDIPRLWRNLARAYTPSEHRLKLCDATFRDFARFVRGRGASQLTHPCETIADVTPELARAFFNELSSRYAWETVRGKMSLLARAYAHFAPAPEPNPFKIAKRSPISTKDRSLPPPLTRQQIEAVQLATQPDPFFHPLIVTAICTGMRIGDVCNLKWTDLDLQAGFVCVPAAAGGGRIAIPILDALRAILEVRFAAHDMDDCYVFPEAARRYNFQNGHGLHSLRGYIINGLKPIFGQLLASATPASPHEPPPSPLTEDDVAARIRAAGFAPGKTERLVTTYHLFVCGRPYSQIAVLTGKSKGQCSEDLKAIERLTGQRLRPGSSKGKYADSGRTVAQLVEATRRRPPVGNRQISLYGWRTFRIAFHTVAREAGLAPEKIEMIIGHAAMRRMQSLEQQTQALTVESTASPADRLAARILSLARTVITPRQAEIVNAVLHAAGVDADVDSKRALALVGAVVSKTRTRIAAVLKAAGI